MRLNASRKELALKIVYYGPGLSGKTTNLMRLHSSYPIDQRGELVKLDTETERTLFFDYFPLQFGSIGGYRIKIDFFTVPGQSFYAATRKAVLEGVDGVVFVADSSPFREEANLVSREDMVRTLAKSGRTLDGIPHIYQWNKRDLRDALPTRVLERTLNPEGVETIEAVASNGVGVWETQARIVKLVMLELRQVSRQPRSNV